VWVATAVLLHALVSHAAGGREEAKDMIIRAEKMKRPQDAEKKVELLRAARELDPSNVDGARELALSSAQLMLGPRLPDDPEGEVVRAALDALEAYRKIAHRDKRVQPRQICDMLVNIGHQLEGRDRPLMGLEVYLASQRHDPSHGNTIGSLYKVREWLCDWGAGGGRDKEFAALMTIVRSQLGLKDDVSGGWFGSGWLGGGAEASKAEERAVPATQTSLQPLTALSQEVDVATQLYIARAWTNFYVGRSSPAAKGNRFLAGAKYAKPKQGRITVGYISADLRGHAVSHQMMMVFKQHHQSARVRVVVLNTFGGNIGKDGTEIKGYVDEWADVAQVQGEALVATIANTHKIHILVDMAGHTFGHRLSTLARRPAPVAMTYLGYASSTGADFIDYMISDAIVSPPEAAGASSESLAWLPYTFYPLNTRQPVARQDKSEAVARGEQGLPAGDEGGEADAVGGAFIYACFNRNLKIKPDVWEVWMQVLRDNPGSVLWLRRFHARVQENLKAHAAAANISSARLVFAGRLPDRAAHLARHRLAHLFLDTPRFGGHSTLADVVWAGVPSIVLPGEIMASRIGASLVSAVGAGAFVARNLEDYRQMAHAAARRRHRDTLLRYREQITAAITHAEGPVASAPYTERLEGLYRLAWEVFRARRQPKDAPVVIGGTSLAKLREKAPALVFTRHRAAPVARTGGRRESGRFEAAEQGRLEIVEEPDD